MPASTRARAAAPKVTLRFWMRSDLDCVHFEQAMGSGWFDWGNMTKNIPLQACLSAPMLAFWRKANGKTTVYPEIDFSAHTLRDTEFYCVFPRKEWSPTLSANIEAFDNYAKAHFDKILSMEIEALLWPLKRKISGTLGASGYSMLMADDVWRLFDEATSGALQLGALVDKQGTRLPECGFVKYPVLPLEYVDDGAMRPESEGGGWRSYKVVPQQLRECAPAAFALHNQYDSFGFRPLILRRQAVEKMRELGISRKFFLQHTLVHGTPLQIQHQEIWEKILGFMRLNEHAHLY